MQRLEVSGAVRPIYGSLGVKRLIVSSNRAWLCDSYFYRNYFQRLCSEKYIVFFNIVSDIVGHCTVATASAEV